MSSILIVCTANICRSPVGEALLRYILQQRGLTDWKVDSAGTFAYPGQPASVFSVQAVAELNIDISHHRSKRVSKSLLRNADLVLCMELRHVNALRAEYPAHSAKIFTLGQMSGHAKDVADPYGGSLKDYQYMVKEVKYLLESGIDKIIYFAEKNHQNTTG